MDKRWSIRVYPSFKWLRKSKRPSFEYEVSAKTRNEAKKMRDPKYGLLHIYEYMTAVRITN